MRQYLVASYFLFSAFAWNVEAKECTSEDARAAEAGIESLKSWSSMYEAFEAYGHCDDGAIAEGWTEAVVHTLASDWNSLIQASQYAQKDDGFRRFLLKHIDASADTGEIEAIGTMARSRCPPKLEVLCEDIYGSVREALSQ
jgi:hypothetical protein